MTQPGNFAWTIDIPDRFLAVSAKYVLRFKLPAESFDPGTGELSSPGFLVLRSIIETSTSASVSSSSSTISTTPSSISPATATPTQTNDLSKSQLTSSETSPGMGSGAKAGIGIGVAVGVIGIIAASWFFLSRKRKPSEVHELGDNKAQPNQDYAAGPPVELSSQNSKARRGVVELPAYPHWGIEVREIEVRTGNGKIILIGMRRSVCLTLLGDQFSSILLRYQPTAQLWIWTHLRTLIVYEQATGHNA